jgi:endonuclease/exonuclease/phosphatase (EEP) superfamily protein YafD
MSQRSKFPDDYPRIRAVLRPLGSLRGALLTLGCLAVLAVLINAQAESQWFIAVVALFWHYVWPVLAFVTLLAGWIVQRLRPVAASAILAGLIIVFGAVAGDLWANATSSARPPILKVVTYNWLGGGRDRADFFAWVSKERPDILCIQEFPATAPDVVLGLRKTLPFVSEAKGDVVIFSRYPLVKERGASFHWRPIVEVTALAEQGPIHIYGAHAPTLRDVTGVIRRNVYLDGTIEFINEARGPKIVLGDFNATRWDPYLTRMRGKLGLHDQGALFPHVTRILAHRFGLDWGSPIDQVMVSSGLKVYGCRVGPTLGSDHRPLICLIQT